MGSNRPQFESRRWINLAVSLLVFLIVSSANAQGTAKASPPAGQARIVPRLLVLSESVVREQWSHSAKMVNAPRNSTELNPGQCVRLGLYSTGPLQEKYLADTTLTFYAQHGDQKVVHQSVSLTEIKQIKPVGSDFVLTSVAGTLGKKPVQSSYSMGIARLNWCVPVDATDGSVVLEADVYLPDGQQVLKSSPVHIQSFETGSKMHFKTNREFEAFLPTYYRQPNSARLLPVLEFMVAEQTEHPTAGFEENVSAFLVAAIKADPLAAEDFQMRIASQPAPVRLAGMNILRTAGHYVDGQVNTWSAEEQSKFRNLPALADPFDPSLTANIVGHLDRLWSTFWATGQLEPVKVIASDLAWAADYAAWEKQKKSGSVPAALTPEMIRAQRYQTAGRSLAAFQRNNPLIADYIDYLYLSADTPTAVKTALGTLQSDPTFRQSLPTGTKPAASASAPKPPAAPPTK